MHHVFIATTTDILWFKSVDIFVSGTETKIGEVCGIDTEGDCCGWKSNIEIKKCLMGFIYKLGVPTDCPRSYCVGSLHHCKEGEIHHKSTNSCLGNDYFVCIEHFLLLNLDVISWRNYLDSSVLQHIYHIDSLLWNYESLCLGIPFVA